MASLADVPDLVGFFSYSREDDEDSGGKLSKLRERIQAELRGQLGRTKRDFRLWQDKTAIAHGELWEDSIKSAVAESVFFIPIITPTAVRSYHCKFEFDSFLARETELGRSNLVFPILYIPVPALMGDRWRDDPLLVTIGSRQYEEWQNLRHLDPSSTEVSLRVEKLCANICRALQQPWLSPQERQEAEARRTAEEERRRQEKLQEEARQRAEEERRREEAETKRRLDEAEAEKRRQDKERRRLEKEAALAAKKERPHQWRGAAAAGAAVVALLTVGGIWLYRTTTPAGVTSAVVQPDAPGADKAKAAADAEAKRKAAEAEQQRQAKAAADAEARRKAAEAEQQGRMPKSPATSPSPGRLFTIRSKTEAIGYPAINSAVVRSIGECEQNCTQSATCKIFTYRQDTGTCRTYSRATFLPNDHSDSGELITSFEERSNMRATGSSIDGATVSSIGECEEKCSLRGALCKVFSFYKFNKQCYLYSSADLTPDGLYDSGIRIPTSTTGLFTIRTNTEAVGFSQETYPRYVPSKDNCEQNCARSADCKVFAYNKDTGMCYKYTQAPSAALDAKLQTPSFAPNEKFDSGIRN